jgi:hypothetical protein
MDLKEIWYEGVNWIYLAIRSDGGIFVDKVIHLRFPLMGGDF